MRAASRLCRARERPFLARSGTYAGERRSVPRCMSAFRRPAISLGGACFGGGSFVGAFLRHDALFHTWIRVDAPLFAQQAKQEKTQGYCDI